MREEIFGAIRRGLRTGVWLAFEMIPWVLFLLIIIYLAENFGC